VLVIGGMHRSGTSLTASLMQGAGLFIGPRLMGPYQGNERGHFEDLDFYEFHKRALTASGFHEDGFLASGRPQVPADLVPVAEALVADRRARDVPWGWKDPRTIAFLDFWLSLLPEARFLFVVRSPWAVAASLARRGDRPVQEDPSLAIRSWLHFNRLILEFVTRHPQTCLVREVGQVAADPAAVCAAIRDRLGVPLGDPPALFEPDLLSAVPPPAYPRSAFEAEAAEVYRSLRSLAGLADDAPGPPVPRVAPAPRTALPVLFAGHTDPGFCIHMLGMLAEHCHDEPPVPRCLPLEQNLGAVRSGNAGYSVVLAVRNALSGTPWPAALSTAAAAIAADVEAGRCRLFFDFSNEAAHRGFVEKLLALARDAGIQRSDGLTLICQNRLLEGTDVPMHHAVFDTFLVAEGLACREALEAEGLDLDVDPAAVHLPEPTHDVCCLNATPRFHRIVTLLALADAGLIDLDAPDHDPACQIPYISFPGLSYDKTGPRVPTTEAAVVAQLEAAGHGALARHLPRLLARAPLRVDTFSATGNALAFAIDLRHYRDAKLSVVTETALSNEVQRITEKIFKPLALGQPCVTLGHPHMLAVARSLGFDTFDDCIVNAYDRVENPRARIAAAIEATAAFLQQWDVDPTLRARVRAGAVRNMRWTRRGFLQHYHETFGRPLLAAILDPALRTPAGG
jgi:hypothetical protein